MITHNFNKTLQILEVNYSGCITLNEFLAFGNWVAKNIELPRNLRILTDATDAEYKLSKEDFEIILSALHYNCQFYDFIKAAYIQHKPIETAYSTLLQFKNNIPNYQHAVFYTYESALDWLLS